MSERAGPDWIWLTNGAVDEFKQWRIQAGATTASASSYATGARAFGRYCRSANLNLRDALESFPAYLARTRDLSVRAQSDYQSHGRAFVRFLQESHRSQLESVLHPETLSSPSQEATPSVSAPPAGDHTVEQERTAESPGRAPMEAEWHGSLVDASTADLLAGYAKTLEVLRKRGVLRTANAPSGDFAEWLVWRAFGGVIEPNSTKSHDVTDAVGRKLQVKARLVSQQPTPGQLQTSVFRSWTFDFAVLVQLAERDYSVVRASMLPAHLFDDGRANARWSQHVKGWAVFMTPALMGHLEGVDVTEQLRSAAAEGLQTNR